jgi:hypothetical protein
MPSLIRELFSNIWALFTDIIVSGFFIFAILVYYHLIPVNEKVMLVLMAIGYGLVLALSIIQLVRQRRHEEWARVETEKTIVLNYIDMFFVEFFAFLAAVGTLGLAYWLMSEISVVNIIQSLFIFGVVKLVNWYYLSRQI